MRTIPACSILADSPSDHGEITARGSIRHALHLFACALLAAVMVSGCVTDPRAADVGNRNNFVRELESVALDDSAVALRWTVETSPTTENESGYHEGYSVSWYPVDGREPNDAGSLFVPANRNEYEKVAVIGGLGHRLYKFSVVTVFHDLTSYVEMAECTAAPAAYYTTDAARPGEEIRLYESGSSLGSGLILDPAKGGPTRVAIDAPPPNGVDLELRTGGDISNGRLHLGSPCRDLIPYGSCTLEMEYSVLYQTCPQLAEWYIPRLWSYSSEIGPRYLWADLPRGGVPGVDLGFGFVGRLGAVDDPNARYVRFHVMPDQSGFLLRGTAPDRYVVLTISLGYPGVPYA